MGESELFMLGKRAFGIRAWRRRREGTPEILCAFYVLFAHSVLWYIFPAYPVCLSVSVPDDAGCDVFAQEAIIQLASWKQPKAAGIPSAADPWLSCWYDGTWE